MIYACIAVSHGFAGAGGALPRIVGLLAAGILLGPCALNLIDDSVLSISSELRQIALIIILIRAGLSLNPADLKAVDRRC